MQNKPTPLNLNKYDLFGTKNNAHINRILQVDLNKIVIYLKAKIHIETIKLWKTKVYKNSFKDEIFTGFAIEQKGNEIILIGDFNTAYNYKVEINQEQIPVILDPKINGIIDQHLSPDDNEFLGALVHDDYVLFKIWSPPAICIKLIIFDSDASTIIAENIQLEKSANGVHIAKVYPSQLGKYTLENCFYQYKIFAYGKVTTGLDPYSPSMAIFNPNDDINSAKSAIIKVPQERPTPSFRNAEKIKSQSQIIAYELHTRDFSIEPDFCNPKHAGTFKAIGENIEYFRDLGITHIQIMPVNKCHRQNDIDKQFSQNISNYNWGYDPLNYFTLEGRYAVNPDLPTARIFEFREMASRLHQSGIGLIADVVFNHIYSASTFENVAPGCYLRFNDDFKISEKTGAGASLESRRKAVRKMIIDAGIYYVKTLGVDGFRFDLMEFTDSETLKQFRQKVGEAYNADNINDLIIQGEAWEFKDLKYNESFTKLYHPKGLQIAMFNDVMRDASLGHKIEGGFFQGNKNKVAELASAVVGAVASFDQKNFPFAESNFFHPYNLFADQPCECLNYLSIHDGLTLRDKINLTIKDPSEKLRLQIAKQSLTLLFSSQGRVILHAGTESLRSKPVAECETDNPRAFTSPYVDDEEGVTHFHDNSYQSPDFTNMIRHSRRHNHFADLVKSMTDYIKGLVEMRKSCEAFRYETKQDVCKAVRFLVNENDSSSPKINKINSFKSHHLQSLEIEFINGSPNEVLYLTGEIHPHEANPVKNCMPVYFNNYGSAIVSFTKEQIAKFDLNRWSNWHLLDVKLVRTPGQWDFPQEYYSASGCNSISPYSLNDDFRATIDLSQQNTSSYFDIKGVESSYLAYKIENLRPNADNIFSSANCFFVIHNASDERLYFRNSEFKKYQKLLVHCDSVSFSSTGLNCDVKINGDEVVLPPHCSTIISGRG